MRKCNVMLVEDNEEILGIFKSWLIRRGFQTTATTNPYDALAVAAVTKIDVAVIDMTLPGMNGLELIDKLKQICDFQVIVLSGDDNPKLQKQAMERNVFRYLLKPVSMRTIEEVILESLEVSSAKLEHIL